MNQCDNDRVYVWDPFLRVFHWAVVATFSVAYLTEHTLSVHVWAGYAIGILVTLRVVWGFIGPRHARFGDFLYSPKKVIGYIAGLLTFQSRRYIGHSPGGGAMVIILLLTLVITVATGLVVYGTEKHAGPLAALLASGQGARSPWAESMEDLHEFLPT